MTPLLHEINPTIKGVPVPNRGDKVNIEELANTNPDLILIQESMAMDEGEVRKLEELKVPYLVASFNSMKEQQQSIAMIGKAIGKAKGLRNSIIITMRLFHSYLKK